MTSETDKMVEEARRVLGVEEEWVEMVRGWRVWE